MTLARDKKDNTRPKMATKLDRGPELYETPVEATRALIRAERVPEFIWEPACGRGAIASELEMHGAQVYATDLNDWGYGVASGRDFLTETIAPYCCQTIVTNPPYSLAEKFITHGLKLCRKVIYLLPVRYLEGVRKNCPAMDNGQLARVHVFRNRLPEMHRDGWAGPKHSNATAYAWFVFERDHKGPATLTRISWEKRA